MLLRLTLLAAITTMIVSCTSSTTNPGDDNVAKGQEYLPTTTGSSWTYKDDRDSVETSTIVGSVQHGGKTYTDIDGSDDALFLGNYRNDGQSIYVAMFDDDDKYIGEVVFLPYTQPVGYTWNIELAGDAGTDPTTATLKITSKNSTVTVPAGTYKDVMVMEMSVVVDVFGAPLTMKQVISFSRKYGVVKQTEDSFGKLKTTVLTKVTIK